MSYYIQRSDGRPNKEHSKGCPMCAGKEIERKLSEAADFDEKGWYYTANFTCLNKKCNHTWTELVRARDAN